MSWICPECGNSNRGYLIRCVCGYEDEISEAGYEDEISKVGERIGPFPKTTYWKDRSRTHQIRSVANIRDRTPPDFAKLPVTIYVTLWRELLSNLIVILFMGLGIFMLSGAMEDTSWSDKVAGIMLIFMGGLCIWMILTCRSITTIHAGFIHRIEKRYFGPDQEFKEPISRYTGVELSITIYLEDNSKTHIVRLKNLNSKRDVILWEPTEADSIDHRARAFWETASGVLQLPKLLHEEKVV